MTPSNYVPVPLSPFASVPYIRMSRDLLRDVLVRLRVADAEVAAELAQDAAVVDVHPLAVLPPRFDRAVLQREALVGHDQLRVELADRPQAVAVGAGAVRAS